MKNIILLSLVVFMVTFSLGYSQTNQNSTGFAGAGNSRPGLLNITELNAGMGLYSLNRDYAKWDANLTSILGIGLTKNIVGGIGVGVSLYNGGTLVPLFADFRYFFNIGKTRFYASGDGGILLNSAKTDGGTKYLVSPGLGVTLPVGDNLAVNMGAALFTQFRSEDKGHDSFINLKVGVTYFFKKS